MKVIYISRKDFMCHMSDIGGCMRHETSLFDGSSDQDIEQTRYVPMGYTWTDPDTGLSYSGEHMENTAYASAKEIAMQNALEAQAEAIAVQEAAIAEQESAINDCMTALVELAEMIVEE